MNIKVLHEFTGRLLSEGIDGEVKLSFNGKVYDVYKEYYLMPHILIMFAQNKSGLPDRHINRYIRREHGVAIEVDPSQPGHIVPEKRAFLYQILCKIYSIGNKYILLKKGSR